MALCSCGGAFDFYPRSPCGERLLWLLTSILTSRFLSTLSLRRATAGKGPAVKGYRNFYPRSPCGERQWRHPLLLHTKIFLSTLSLRRATLGNVVAGLLMLFLSTLSLRRATPGEHHASTQQEFLSTLSLRRATYLGAWKSCNVCDFYPRSPCGERQPGEHHASTQKEFLSTLSLRRATQRHSPDKTHRRISIHALLAESDQ